MGGTEGVGKGARDVCTCVHTRHAYRAHTYTLTCQGVHGHTCMHTTNARPRSRGRDAEARTIAGAQQSTGTPSVEKIMPVVGS